MWNRTFGREKMGSIFEHYKICNQLTQVLAMLDCRRMVVGHTPQVPHHLMPSVCFSPPA